MNEDAQPWKAVGDAIAGFSLSLAMLPGLVNASSTQRAFEPGLVVATQAGDNFSVKNRAIGAKWSVTDKVNSLVVTDQIHGTELRVAVPFAILLKAGSIYDADSMKVVGRPARHELTPRPDASRYAERLHGEEFDFPLESSDHSLRVVWSLILLDGSSYLRQLVSISAVGQDVPINRVELLDLPLPGANVSGSVPGSPIVAGNFFIGFEDPLSKSKVTGDRATAWMDRDLPLRAGQSIMYSSVIGCRSCWADAAGFSRLYGEGAGAPLQNFSSLQLLVRSRLLHAL